MPRTPRIAVGVLTFIAPGELRAMSPDTIESVPLRMSVSIEPVKLLELNLYSAERHLAVRAERHHGVVDEGDADRAVGAGLEHVLLEERVAGLRRATRLPSRTTKAAPLAVLICATATSSAQAPARGAARRTKPVRNAGARFRMAVGIWFPRFREKASLYRGRRESSRLRTTGTTHSFSARLFAMGDIVETSLSLAADREAMGKIRSLIDQFGASQGIAGEDIARIIIAVEELVTNTVKYGYAPGAATGTATFTLRLEGARLSIEYVDDAHEFNPFAAPDPDFDAPVEARRVGGLGLHIVKALMDRTAYRREGGRNIMELSRLVTIAK